MMTPYQRSLLWNGALTPPDSSKAVWVESRLHRWGCLLSIVLLLELLELGGGTLPIAFGVPETEGGQMAQGRTSAEALRLRSCSRRQRRARSGR